MPAAWAGRPIAELEAVGESRVVAVTRLGVAQVASSSLLVQEGDVVWLSVDGDRMDDVDARLVAGPTSEQGRH